ncbi:hypothetical protein BH24ACT25_BH24ACT25_02530 [soil metagenome]
MDRKLLADWLEDGLSLPQIGEAVGRDPSTVGYWVSKYGLVANGRDKYAPRGGLGKDELEPLIERGATLKQIADELGRSVSTVRHWLGVHGLRTEGRQRNRAAGAAAWSAGEARFMGSCRRHGVTDFFVFKSGRSRCARCNSEAVARRRRRVKRTLVEEAGGRCTLCGYDRYVGALHFHHLDPTQKTFSVSHEGVTRAIAKARAEIGKCVLLCSNCHAEVEGGVG